MSKTQEAEKTTYKKENYKYGLRGKRLFIVTITSLFLSSSICFWALEKKSCFEVHFLGKIIIKAGDCN